MPTVYDSQGDAYSAIQLTASAQINGQIIPAGWWVVTDVRGNRSPVNPSSFDTMFTPVQGVYNLGQAGGAAQLDQNTKVIQRLNYEGIALGVATLDANMHVAQAGAVNPITAGQAGGLATLTNGAVVQQHSAWEGVASGVVALDSQGHAVTLAGTPSITQPSGGAASIAGTDEAIWIEIQLSSGGAGLVCQVTFARAWLNVPVMVMSILTTTAAKVFSIGARSTTGFGIYADAAPTLGALYDLQVICRL